MSAQESSRPSSAVIIITHLVNLAIFGVIVFMLWLMLPFILERLGVAPTVPMLPTIPTAAVATPRPGIRAPARPQVQPPAVAPTPYTLPTAEAIADQAYQQAIQQAEVNAAPLPNASKAVIQEPSVTVNSDWCRGAHLDNPECQPQNGQKVER